jgi:hypothetical protein
LAAVTEGNQTLLIILVVVAAQVAELVMQAVEQVQLIPVELQHLGKEILVVDTQLRLVLDQQEVAVVRVLRVALTQVAAAALVVQGYLALFLVQPLLMQGAVVVTEKLALAQVALVVVVMQEQQDQQQMPIQVVVAAAVLVLGRAMAAQAAQAS